MPDTSDDQQSTTGEQPTRVVTAEVTLSKGKTNRQLKQKTPLPKRPKPAAEQLTELTVRAESVTISEATLVHDSNLP